MVHSLDDKLEGADTDAPNQKAFPPRRKISLQSPMRVSRWLVYWDGSRLTSESHHAVHNVLFPCRGAHNSAAPYRRMFAGLVLHFLRFHGGC